MKFYVLIIAADLSIKRDWVTQQDVLSILKSNPDLRVYRTCKDQEAFLIDRDTNFEQLVWIDVKDVERSSS